MTDTIASADFQVILFAGNPTGGELNVAELQQELGDEVLACLHSPDLAGIQEVMATRMPDLLCLFADDLTARGEDPGAYCARLRSEPPRYRPTTVVITDSGEEGRIHYLMEGADDILSGTLSSEEFKVRLLVHLRRSLDNHAHPVTRLPDLEFAARIVQRRLNRNQPVALLAVELDSFEVYDEVYGQLAAAQVLKTFAAMLGQLVIFPDFVTQSEENTYVIATQPDRAEKLASLLCRQFENVAPNFYSEKDRDQGYIISVMADQVSRRVPLLSLSIGIAGSTGLAIDSFLTAFNGAMQMRGLARMTPGSSWVSDRPRLAGEATAVASHKPRMLVLESDAALAYLLKTTLEMEGYGVDTASGIGDARESLSEQPPEVIILDAVMNGDAVGHESGLALCREVREQYPGVSIICTSSLHDRQKVLRAGADLYLPKPYDLMSLFAWIQRMLNPAV